MANVFEFDVGVSTHDALKSGVAVHHWTRVTVAADSRDEAALVAAQVASCGGWMPTDTLDRI
jgi:hypothetical protein